MGCSANSLCVLLVGAFFVTAQAQVTMPACTPTYVEELKDELAAIDGLKRLSVDQLRPICKGIDVAEQWTGRILGSAGDWLKDQVKKVPGGASVDPKTMSNMCKWFRKTGEAILVPPEERARIAHEVARCEAELRKGN
jgi:hypothetical protein